MVQWIVKQAGSQLRTYFKPKDLIVQICTCRMDNMGFSKSLMTMPDLRDAFIGFVEAWPSVESLTFFYCGNSDVTAPHSNIHIPAYDDLSFPALWRSAFDQDARYFGPWVPVKKKGGSDGGWLLKCYGVSGLTRTADLEFFNVADVYGVKCALDVGIETK